MRDLENVPLTPVELAEIVTRVNDKTLTRKQAEIVFNALWALRTISIDALIG